MNDINVTNIDTQNEAEQNLAFGGHVPFILASKSAVRAKILKNAGFQFEVKSAEIDEQALQQKYADQTAVHMALTLAEAKAKAASLAHLGELILGCDQILEFQGKILHKAPNMEALQIKLQSLQGQSHHLTSAIALYQNGNLIGNAIANARLKMRPLNALEIEGYIKAADPSIINSVGGYHLEGLGAQLFTQIEGDYFTILGLPLFKFMALMRHKGFLQ